MIESTIYQLPFDSVTKGSTKNMYIVSASQALVQEKYYIQVKFIVLLNCYHDGGKRVLKNREEGILPC